MYSLEVSVQAELHAIHFRKAFGGTAVRIAQVPFELILKPDRADDDVQLIAESKNVRNAIRVTNRRSRNDRVRNWVTHLDQDPHLFYRVIVLILINRRAPAWLELYI